MKIEIPVKGYTLKFLHRHLGLNYKLSRIDPYGLHLFTMLRSPRINARFDALMKQYTTKFVVSIEPGQVFDFGLRNGVVHFSTVMTNDFNAWAEKIFKHEFHTYVATAAEFGIPVFTAIRRYCELHSLNEEDISQETLRTSYKRYQKKEKKRLATANSSLPLNQAA